MAAPQADRADISGAAWRSRRAGILAMAPALGFAFILSHFLRSAPAVIAPDLRAELDLSATQLSNLPAAIFLGAALMQLPVGVALDRFGPRRTMAFFLVVAAIGTLLFASARGAASLTVALFLIGCGAAPVFMGVIVLLSRWVERQQLATATAVAIAVGGGGMLLSASPFAAATELYGWRASLAVVGVGAFALAALLFFTVRDRPPDAAAPAHDGETLLETIAGLRLILADRRLYAFAAMTSLTVAALLSVRNLWVGPYLSDVYGLDLIARGHVIFVMSVAWLVSALMYGPLDRIFDTRRGVVSAGAACMATMLVLLALNDGRSVWLAAALLVGLGLTSALASPIFAQARSLFPDRYTGRLFTTINVCTWTGVFVIQLLTGLIVGAFPTDAAGASPLIAYRMVFAALAVGLIAAIAVYRRVDDVPPSRDGVAPDDGEGGAGASPRPGG